MSGKNHKHNKEQKVVTPSEVNNDPEVSKPKSEIQNTPTQQAQVAPEAKIMPVQPEAPSASDVTANVGIEPHPVIEGSENRKDLHTITDSDLEEHPELKEQGFKSGEALGFEKAWIYQYPTASREDVVQVQWPRDVSAAKL